VEQFFEGTKRSNSLLPRLLYFPTFDSDGARLSSWGIPAGSTLPMESDRLRDPSDQLFDVRSETLALLHRRARQHKIHLNFFATYTSLFATRFRISYRACYSPSLCLESLKAQAQGYQPMEAIITKLNFIWSWCQGSSLLVIEFW